MSFAEQQSDDYIKQMTEYYRSSDMQENLKQLVKNTPEEFRERILKQELSVYGYEIENGVFLDNIRNPLPDKEREKVMKNVDRRMLSESPSLREHKLQLVGGYLLPDADAIRRDE
jgi:hypothetical protein